MTNLQVENQYSNIEILYPQISYQEFLQSNPTYEQLVAAIGIATKSWEHIADALPLYEYYFTQYPEKQALYEHLPELDIVGSMCDLFAAKGDGYE